MTSVLALTCGDPSGIGPEIAVAAWLAGRAGDVPPFYLLADPKLISARADSIGLHAPIETVTPEAAAAAFAQSLPIVPLAAPMIDTAGVPSSENAAGIIEAIERGFDDVVSGRAAALVTNPISKKPLYDAGFEHPGHTEFLGALCARAGLAARPVMMLAGPSLRAVPVTIHIALTQVPKSLTTEAIVEVCTIIDDDMKTRFGLARPRLAVAGLNPHAGEGGSMGREDIEIVAPAVAALQARGIDAWGPLPADTMFHARAREGYDVAVCMYHDQALIPAKTLAFDETVNVTLGLPIIRTSPDHGTAFDIAGEGIARPDSLIAALKLARSMADRQTGA